jgi:hypothetical protein
MDPEVYCGDALNVFLSISENGLLLVALKLDIS